LDQARDEGRGHHVQPRRRRRPQRDERVVPRRRHDVPTRRTRSDIATARVTACRTCSPLLRRIGSVSRRRRRAAVGVALEPTADVSTASSAGATR
jgi:hypothetical protein